MVIFSDSDPVQNCDVYKKIGCSHVDGMLCDMKTCNILKVHREGKFNQPPTGEGEV
jgi:hypothetical protein